MSLQTGSALQFDGSQNYVDIGTLGNMGSTMNNGVYVEFDYKSTSTALGCVFGTFNVTATTTAIQILMNSSETEANVAGKITAFLRQESGANTTEGATTAAIANLNNGQWHNVIITINGATNIITITVDGVLRAITYSSQTTPVTFANFTRTGYIGARHVGVNDRFLNGSLDNVKLGTGLPGATTLYAYYKFDEGVGTTAADSSAQAGTGTLTGTPVPTWILGSSLPYTLSAAPHLKPRPFAPGIAR